MHKCILFSANVVSWNNDDWYNRYDIVSHKNEYTLLSSKKEKIISRDHFRK